MKSLAWTFIFSLGVLLACAPRTGPAGLNGFNGQDGTNGVDGVNGVDAVPAQPLVYLCHRLKAHGNHESELYVPVVEVDMHLGHGDYLGACL